MPIILKLLVFVGLAFAIVGGCLSIAGPIVALNLDPTDLNQINLHSMTPQIKDMLFYFDCDKLGDITSLTQTLSNTSIQSADVPVRSSARTHKDLCENAKSSHVFLGAFTGSFTLFGCIVFVMCMMHKRVEPEFVYVVPLILAIVMLYDFMETNSKMLAFVKDCTEYEMFESEKIDQLRNIVIFGEGIQRWGVIDDGVNVCNTTGACSMAYANNDILCTRYYDCSMSADDCLNLDVSMVPDLSQVKIDDAIDSIGSGVLLWCLGPIFTIVGAGLLKCISLYLKFFVNPDAVSPEL